MWCYAAESRDNPIVAGYELMCEPDSNEVGSCTLSVRLYIWDPDEFYVRYGRTLYDRSQLYPDIVAIRQADSSTRTLDGCHPGSQEPQYDPAFIDAREPNYLPLITTAASAQWAPAPLDKVRLRDHPSRASQRRAAESVPTIVQARY